MMCKNQSTFRPLLMHRAHASRDMRHNTISFTHFSRTKKQKVDSSPIISSNWLTKPHCRRPGGRFLMALTKKSFFWNVGRVKKASKNPRILHISCVTKVNKSVIDIWEEGRGIPPNEGEQKCMMLWLISLKN